MPKLGEAMALSCVAPGDEGRGVHLQPRGSAGALSIAGRALILAALTGVATVAGARPGLSCTEASPCVEGPIDLGNLGGTSSDVYGVSGDGSVAVGGSMTMGNAFQHAYRWEGGAMVDLGTLGGNNSFAYGVSRDGSTVVGYSTLAGETEIHAFRWQGGVMVDLGTLGGSQSFANGVSGDGSVVVGDSSTTGNAFWRAFRWEGGVMTDIGTLGGTESSAKGVSGDGSTVVGYSTTAGNAELHAFRWAVGAMSDLGTLGGSYSYAFGVNNDGSVVVGNAGTAGDEAQHAFRWSGGVMSDIGTLGGSASSANSVSGDGSVVVGYSYTTGEAAIHAFRWTSATGMQDLNALMANAGVNMAGVVLVEARAVSANGQFIVGYGYYNNNPSTRSFLVRYDAGIGGLTTDQSVQSSIDDLSGSRLGQMAQQHGLAAPLLDVDQPLGGKCGVRAFVSSGTASAGGSMCLDFGGGFALIGGLAFAKDSYDRADLDHAVMGAIAARYIHSGTGRWRPFVEAGGWLAPNAALTFVRDYDNGAGTATGSGSTNAHISYLFTRAGMLLAAGQSDQVAISAEYGRQRMDIDGYGEQMSASNPFEAQVDAGSDRIDLAKLRLQWSHTFGPRVEGTLWVAGVHGFNRSSSIVATVQGAGSLVPTELADTSWCEYGARVGYHLSERVTLDVFANGVSGGDGIDTRVHLGGGLSFKF